MLHRRPPKDAAAFAAPAAGEVASLIDAGLSHTSGVHRDRVVGLMQLRYGLLGKVPRTYSALAALAGVSGERIRQVEAGMLASLSARKGWRPLPGLSAAYEAAQMRAGWPWDYVERLLGPELGPVPLEASMRLYGALCPELPPVGRLSARAFTAVRLWIVGGSPADAGVVRAIGRATTELLGPSGAATVRDVAALVELALKDKVDDERLLATIDAIPGVEWLDDASTAFWMPGGKLAPVLRRAALVLEIAGCPMRIEDLHTGLERRNLRQPVGRAARMTGKVPPLELLATMLSRHSAFQVSDGQARLRQRLNLVKELSPFHGALVACLNEHGGVAARADLKWLAHGPGALGSEEHFEQTLRTSEYIVRLQPQVYGIRGRALDPAAITRAAAKRRSSPASSRDRPAVTQLEFQIRITDGLRRKGNLFLPRHQVPIDAPGEFVLPDGHVAVLIDTSHGVQLTRIGPMRTALRAPGGTTLAIRLDLRRRILHYEVRDSRDRALIDPSNGATPSG